MRVPEKTYRTPIKGNVLRQAGQSVREYLEEFVEYEALRAVLPLVLVAFWCLLEILYRYVHAPTPLWLLIFLVLLAIANFGYRFSKVRRRAKQLQQGADGERFVAQVMERDLIPLGYHVFHDLPIAIGDRRFNIDHLVVGANGVFCIETKTWSKPQKGDTVATFDGKQILLNGKMPKNDAVRQAKALSKEIERRIQELAGKPIKVFPCVVCVGWYVRRTFTGHSEVLVVNEGALASFIQNVNSSLDSPDIALISRIVSDTFAERKSDK